MSIPKDLEYTKDHEWVRKDGELWVVGITHHAQDQLGDVVYVEFPEVGQTIRAGETFGSVESVKAVSDLFAPVSGEVVEVNSALIDGPEVINSDPYGAGWMLKVRTSEAPSDLLSADEYAAHLQNG